MSKEEFQAVVQRLRGWNGLHYSVWFDEENERHPPRIEIRAVDPSIVRNGKSPSITLTECCVRLENMTEQDAEDMLRSRLQYASERIKELAA